MNCAKCGEKINPAKMTPEQWQELTWLRAEYLDKKLRMDKLYHDYLDQGFNAAIAREMAEIDVGWREKEKA